MSNERYKGDPAVLELDDQDDSSKNADLDLSWEESSEFENRSGNQSSWSSWEDDYSDASGGGLGFLE